MKIFAKYSYAQGQAMYMSPATDRVKGLGKRIENHLIKCIVYKNDLNCYNHWVDDEISEWISQINDIELKIKRNPKKFKRNQLDEYIFGNLGDARSDAKSALFEFQKHNRDAINRGAKETYPDFEVEEWMITNLFSATNELRTWACNLLSQNNTETKETLQKHCHFILDKYVY